MSAEEQVRILAEYILRCFPGEITDGGAGEVAVQILEKYRLAPPQPNAASIPDEDIIAEIRMPDEDGNICMTFVLDKWGNVRCWPDFGDPTRIDPLSLGAVAVALETLCALCSFVRREASE